LYQLIGSVFPYYGISSIDIPAISRMPHDYAQFFETLSQNPQRLYDLAGVRFFAGPRKEIDATQASASFASNIARIDFFPFFPPRDPNDVKTYSHGLIEFRNYLPKVTFVPSLERKNNEAEILNRLADPQWNPRQSLLVDPKEIEEMPPFDSLRKISQASSAIELQNYDRHQIKIQVAASQAGYLLINDRFDPHWKATLNGRPVPVFHADFILRGLAVPAGKSVIILNYETASFGVILAIILWSVLGLLAPVWFRKPVYFRTVPS
jgi:hypothetical protein